MSLKLAAFGSDLIATADTIHNGATLLIRSRPSSARIYFCRGEFGCSGSLRAINPLSVSGRE